MSFLYIHSVAVNLGGNMSWKDYLQEVYYDPNNAGSFAGPDKYSGL